MAVDIKTLRIGSHISINGERVEVESLQGGDLVGCITPDNDWFATDSYRFEPVAITPYLLKELGFDYKREGCWQHWWKDGFDLQHRDESECWHFHGDIGFEYLHELENLYYMIYGVELINENKNN